MKIIIVAHDCKSKKKKKTKPASVATVACSFLLFGGFNQNRGTVRFFNCCLFNTYLLQPLKASTLVNVVILVLSVDVTTVDFKLAF